MGEIPYELTHRFKDLTELYFCPFFPFSVESYTKNIWNQKTKKTWVSQGQTQIFLNAGPVFNVFNIR